MLPGRVGWTSTRILATLILPKLINYEPQFFLNGPLLAYTTTEIKTCNITDIDGIVISSTYLNINFYIDNPFKVTDDQLCILQIGDWSGGLTIRFW